MELRSVSARGLARADYPDVMKIVATRGDERIAAVAKKVFFHSDNIDYSHQYLSNERGAVIELQNGFTVTDTSEQVNPESLLIRNRQPGQLHSISEQL